VPGGLSAGVPDGVPGSAAEDAGPEQDSIRSPQTLEALKNAPETAVEVQIPEGAPATITVAVARLAKVSDVRVEKITPGGATVIRRGPVHSVALKLNLQNNDHNLAIKGIVVDLRAPRKTSVYFDDVDPALEPRDSRTIELGPAPYYGDPNALVVRLSGLLFTDGTFWGKVPPPPPPPPPPPRPRDDQQTDEPGDPGKVAVSGPRNSVLKRVQPEFPPLARAAGVEGSVAVEVTIDEEGNVVEAQAWRGHPLLRDAAVAAAREWKFKPTLIQGKPVRVVGTLTFDFSL
jgi:TonB family protein